MQPLCNCRDRHRQAVGVEHQTLTDVRTRNQAPATVILWFCRRCRAVRDQTVRGWWSLAQVRGVIEEQSFLDRVLKPEPPALPEPPQAPQAAPIAAPADRADTDVIDRAALQRRLPGSSGFRSARDRQESNELPISPAVYAALTSRPRGLGRGRHGLPGPHG
jgi:hypothetical protein